MSEVLLNMEGITKEFPGVLALDHVSLKVKKGEVLALLGENGAGKSTLVKILAGAYVKDAGKIMFEGHEVELGTPKSAEEIGISIIYQELNLIPALSVAENIYIGHYLMSHKTHINWKKMHAEARRILDELEMDFDTHTLVKNLGIAQQQMVEVAKALSKEAKLIIMDEPTAPLTNKETENLFRVIHRLRKNGVSIIYISHRLEEAKEICDVATIMRDGKTITHVDIADVSIDDMIKHMVGRELKEKFPRVEKKIGEVMFRAQNITSKATGIQDISFDVKRGEVLCIGGLVGAGRTETARAIFGLDPSSTGKVIVEGEECRIKRPNDAIAAGIGFVTEDRKKEGLVLNMGIDGNITLPSLKKIETGFHLRLAEERRIVEEYIRKLKIKTPSPRQKAKNLSGGNQQKVVLAKWLLSNSKVLIFDEPTRGIDVGAKIEVYNIINQLAKEGKAIIVITSEIPELLGICDRIMVMARGRVSGEMSREEASQEAVMLLATGIGVKDTIEGGNGLGTN